MNEAAPITWLINEINLAVSSTAATGATALVKSIMPLVGACFGIYVILVLFNYMRGAEDNPIMDFLWRGAAFAVVMTLGLHADVYVAVVMPIVQNSGTDIAAAIIGGNNNQNSLDTLALHYLKIIDDSYMVVDGFSTFKSIGAKIVVTVKAAIIVLGLVPFLVAATVATIIANVGSTIVAMVGPLFFAFLLFPATRQYFSAWVNTAVSYALIPIMVAVVANLSISLSDKMLKTGGSSLLNETSFKMVFLAAIANLVLLFVLKQVNSLASSLSAGGINAAGARGGLGSVASSIRNAAKESKAPAQMAGRGLMAVANKLRGNSIKKAG